MGNFVPRRMHLKVLRDALVYAFASEAVSREQACSISQSASLPSQDL